MKRTLTMGLALLLALGLLAACGGDAPASAGSEGAQSAPESSGPEAPEQPVEEAPESQARQEDGEEMQASDTLYRGVVTAITDSAIEVAQAYGFNYGYESVYFHIGEDTEIVDNGLALGEGCFVEVGYDGILTRSLPPQGNAEYVNVLSVFGEGIVVNGEVLSVNETDSGYTVQLSQFAVPGEGQEAPEAESLPEAQGEDDAEVPGLALPDSNTVVLHMETGVFEHMTAEDLVVGAQLSVVTTGVAALSYPPQMSAYAVLPFAP